MNAINHHHARAYPLPPLAYATPRQRQYIVRLLGWADLPTDTVTAAHAGVYADIGMAAPLVGTRVDAAVARLSEAAATRMIGALSRRIDDRHQRGHGSRRRVLDVLGVATTAMTIRAIAETADLDRNVAGIVVHRLHNEKKLRRRAVTPQGEHAYWLAD